MFVRVCVTSCLCPTRFRILHDETHQGLSAACTLLTPCNAFIGDKRTRFGNKRTRFRILHECTRLTPCNTFCTSRWLCKRISLSFFFLHLEVYSPQQQKPLHECTDPTQTNSVTQCQLLLCPLGRALSPAPGAALAPPPGLTRLLPLVPPAPRLKQWRELSRCGGGVHFHSL